MKKILVLFLVLSMLVSALASCENIGNKDMGGDNISDNNGNNSGSNNENNSGGESVNTLVPFGNDSVSEGLEYTLNEGGESYSVSGIGSCTDAYVVVPSTYDGLPVVAVSANAFASTDLVGIKLPDGMLLIDEGAFTDCRSLLTVHLPASLERVGRNAFSQCTKLIEVINHSSLNVYNLYFGIVPENIKFLHTDTTKIMIDDAGYLFSKIDGNNYVIGSTSSEHFLVLPESCEGEKYDIYDYAFMRNGNLVAVVIPDCVEVIHSNAFFDCYNLVSIRLGKGVKTIQDDAFFACNKIYEIINNSELHITFDNASDFGTISSNHDVLIHTGESKIVKNGEYLFTRISNKACIIGYLGNDTGVTLPADFNGESYDIAGFAFFLEEFTHVVIPEGVSSIGDYAFNMCQDLISVTIPESVEYVGSAAFGICYNLTIRCEAKSQPEGWHELWNSSDRPVEWDCGKE